MGSGERRRRRLMPRMQGAAVQCCMCITGVFMFLGGVIMLSTGICLILNYGVFDVELLPTDLQNDEGKKTVGIILTSCGLVAILISVIVSLMYLCNKTKSPVVIPDDLGRMPSSRRTPDRLDRVRTTDYRNGYDKSDRRSSTPIKSHQVSSSSSRQPTKSIPGSTEVVLPRNQYNKRKHKKYPRRRLEGIKEQDAISRKTAEGVLASGLNDTPRSGSFSSEMTNDDMRIPKVVLDHHDDQRVSMGSSSTLQTVTSDGSSVRPLDNDKSRRELQFIPATVTGQDYRDYEDNYSKDSVSISQRDDGSVAYNRGRESEESSIVSNFAVTGLDSSLSNNTYTETSAGGSGSYTQPETAQDLSSRHRAPPDDGTRHVAPHSGASPESFETADNRSDSVVIQELSPIA